MLGVFGLGSSAVPEMGVGEFVSDDVADERIGPAAESALENDGAAGGRFSRDADGDVGDGAGAGFEVVKEEAGVVQKIVADMVGESNQDRGDVRAQDLVEAEGF